MWGGGGDDARRKKKKDPSEDLQSILVDPANDNRDREIGTLVVHIHGGATAQELDELARWRAEELEKNASGFYPKVVFVASQLLAGNADLERNVFPS